MPRFFYTLFFYLALPLIVLRLFYRALRSPNYRRRIAERFGFFSAQAATGGIWVHAVSVGETIAAVPMIRELQVRYPDMPIMVTTMTPTGSDRVQALFGDSVAHVYAPYDIPDAIGRFLNRVRPRLLIIMETELWPNTIHCCHRASIPIVLANARLSAKSAAGYQRFSGLTKPMLKKLSAVVAQSEADGRRFCELGMDDDQIKVSGSIKFDITLGQSAIEQSKQLKALWSEQGRRLIWVAASTRQGEDSIILETFQQLLRRFPNLLLVLVPRHPERFDSVASLSSNLGLQTCLRTQPNSVDEHTQVIIGNTMGELMLFYGCADIAFVGGSLVDTGGHNMLEPAAWGVPVVTGMSSFNFAEISALLADEQALFKVADGRALTTQMSSLIESEQLRLTAGENALRVMEKNRGALSTLLNVAERFI